MVSVRKNKVAPPPTACPLQVCMKFIGGAWTPGLIWFLSAGPRRFSELKQDLRGVTSKMLAERLRQLTELGVVARQEQPTSPPTVEYSLTPLGLELKPAIEAIVSVGHRLKALQPKVWEKYQKSAS